MLLHHKVRHWWVLATVCNIRGCVFFFFFYSLKTIGAELQTQRTSALWFISSPPQQKWWRTHWPYTEGSPWHNSEVQGNYLHLNSAYVKLWSWRWLNRDGLTASHFLWLTCKCLRLLCEQRVTWRNAGIMALVHRQIQKAKKINELNKIKRLVSHWEWLKASADSDVVHSTFSDESEQHAGCLIKLRLLEKQRAALLNIPQRRLWMLLKVQETNQIGPSNLFLKMKH